MTINKFIWRNIDMKTLEEKNLLILSNYIKRLFIIVRILYYQLTNYNNIYDINKS